MKLLILWLLILFLVIPAYGNSVLDVPDLPGKKIIVDGVLDEEVWKDAAGYSGMYILGEKQKASADTMLRVFHSDGKLHLAIIALEPSIGGIRKTVKPGDTKNYPHAFENDDLVELFLTLGDKYFVHLAHNPANTGIFLGSRPTRLLYSDWRQPRLKEKWSLDWDYAVSIQDDRWIVEMSLDTVEFEGFKDSNWKIMLCRERRADGNEFSTLAPIKGKKFRSPEDFLNLNIENVTEKNKSKKRDISGRIIPVNVSDWLVEKTFLQKGDSSFHFSGNGVIKSAESIRIAPEKKYRLSGEFKSVNANDSSLYFGLALLDKHRRPVLPQQIMAVKDTDTILEKDCSAGDDIIYIKDAKGWKKGQKYFVAFNTKPDYSDLPNRKLGRIGGVVDVTKDGTLFKVKLSCPCRQNSAAGTGIREHITGQAYLYCKGKNIKAKAGWKKFSTEFSGFSKPYKISSNSFWPGTSFARILIMTNSEKSESTNIEFRKISFTEER